jgi:hypothetical protein
MDWAILQCSENRTLPEKTLKRSPGDIGIIGKTLTSLLEPGRIEIKNDLFVPDSIQASSMSRVCVLLVEVAVQLLLSFQDASSLSEYHMLDLLSQLGSGTLSSSAIDICSRSSLPE